MKEAALAAIASDSPTMYYVCVYILLLLFSCREHNTNTIILRYFFLHFCLDSGVM